MSSTKSMIGHPQGACGAAGLAATILGMRARQSAPDDQPRTTPTRSATSTTSRTSHVARTVDVALCNCIAFGSKKQRSWSFASRKGDVMPAISRDEFLSFLQNPTRDSYIRLADLMASSSDYDPYSNELASLEHLIETAQFAEIMKQVPEVMSRWVLNPRIHMIGSMAASRMGDETTAKMEGMIALGCLKGIEATGDGTRERPYVVTYTADEYDFMMLRDKEAKGQALVEEDGKPFDVMQFEDGSEMWFDISRPYAVLQRKKET